MSRFLCKLRRNVAKACFRLFFFLGNGALMIALRVNTQNNT